jgi:hypothetical protein
MPQLNLQKKNEEEPVREPVCYFGQTNYRGQLRKFGIKLDDRRRHMYVIGKTGMGKTTMMENMVLHDIYAGNGVGVVDPHGDFAEKILDYIPAGRINDVVYFNPSDLENPIGFNILEVHSEEQKHLVAAGLMAIFKKIWPDVWSSRMEYILNNTLLALLDYPGSTLLGINRLLSDKVYRRKVISKLKDPVVKAFWQTEFASYNERYAQEAVAPIQNKIGQFLSASVIRNMVAQVKSTINIREIMDSKKILIMNLSKGRIGEDNSRLLGGMLITEIQLAAMARVDVPEIERQDFFLYVDEFQNFATQSFANILSEARKYRLCLTMAHQYVAQLEEEVADAVFGNVGTICTFRVGGADAEMLEKEFEPTFMALDIVNLPKFQIFLKLMIDGVSSHPFSSTTMPPIGLPTGSTEKVVKVSRERYGKKRDIIEDKILRWSGMGDLEDEDEDDEGEENLSKGAQVKDKDEKNTKLDVNIKKETKDEEDLKEMEEVKEKIETISLGSLQPRGEVKKGNKKENRDKVDVEEKKKKDVESVLEKRKSEFSEEDKPKKKRKRKKKKKPSKLSDNGESQMVANSESQISQASTDSIGDKSKQVEKIEENYENKKQPDEFESIEAPQRIKEDQIISFDDSGVVDTKAEDKKTDNDLWDDDYKKDK